MRPRLFPHDRFGRADWSASLAFRKIADATTGLSIIDE